MRINAPSAAAKRSSAEIEKTEMERRLDRIITYLPPPKSLIRR